MGIRRGSLTILWALVIIVLGLSIAQTPPADITDSIGLVLFVLSVGVVGTLITDRQPHSPIGWTFVGVLSFTVIDQGLKLASEAYLAHFADSGLVSITTLAFLRAYIGEVLNVAVWWSLLIFPAVYFPNGKLPSPRWRWFPWIVGAALVTFSVAGAFTPDLESPLVSSFENPYAVPAARAVVEFTNPVLLVASVLAPLSLVLRFRRATGVIRQQIKWPLFSALIGVIGLSFILIFGFISSGLSDPAEETALAQVLLTLEIMYVISFPITIGIAILRHRLYDIDIIIRRTIQYALVSAILALVYFGAVFQLQSLFRALTGQDSPLAIVISTLAITVLFNPLRTRVQDFVDRRFYRTRYDAQRALAQFSSTAREEVELESLSQSLMRVVNETLQPEQVSLWLNPKETGGGQAE